MPVSIDESPGKRRRKVDQRLLTLERVIIPVAEGYSVPPRERSRFAVGVCPRLAAQAA